MLYKRPGGTRCHTVPSTSLGAATPLAVTKAGLAAPEQVNCPAKRRRRPMRRTVRVPRWTKRWPAARLMPHRPRPEWWRRAGAVVAVVALLTAAATAVLRTLVEPDGQ